MYAGAPMTASIEPFLRMRSAALVGHLPSGELAYLSDHTGTHAALRGTRRRPARPAHVRRGPVTGAVRSRIDERIVLARDAGGNERHALACLDATRGRELAADPRSRRDPLARRARPRRGDARVHPHRAERRRLRPRPDRAGRRRPARARTARRRVQRLRLDRSRDPRVAHEHAVRSRSVPGGSRGRPRRAHHAALDRDRLRVAEAARGRHGGVRLRRGRAVHAPRDPQTRSSAGVPDAGRRGRGARPPRRVAHAHRPRGQPRRPVRALARRNAARGPAARCRRRARALRATDGSR